MKTTGPAREFLLESVKATTTDCIIWSFNRFRTGYGSAKYKQKTWSAHRLVCALAHGNPPTNGVWHAAHSCGVKLCINPHHLRWATAKENSADKHGHGTKIFGEKINTAKLTESDVLQIRRLTDSRANQTQIATTFGVSNQLISRIGARKIWRHLP
jgi:HNH endonuclease